MKVDSQEKLRRKHEKLQQQLQDKVAGFVPHNETPGHPEFCSPTWVTIRTYDCLRGSPEADANMSISWEHNLAREDIIKTLRRARARMEFTEGQCAEYAATLLRQLADAIEEQGEYNLDRVRTAISRAIDFMEFDLEVDRLLKLQQQLEPVKKDEMGAQADS